MWETSEAIFTLRENHCEQVPTLLCHRNLVEGLDEVNDSETDILWVESAVDLGSCVHGVPWRLKMMVVGLEVVHHPNFWIILGAAWLLHKKKPCMQPEWAMSLAPAPLTS